MLYRPEPFEPLMDEPWDEASVRAAVGEIVADADAAYDERELWPAHEWDGWESALPLTHLYTGAAGVVWALDALRRRGFAEPRLDLARAARRTLEAWRDDPAVLRILELPQPAHSSLLMGATGILLVLWRLEPSEELADELHERVRANVDNPADELMWGAPGTMLAARAMLDWTGEQRWAEAWRDGADALWARRDADGLWTQRLYGVEPHRGLNPPHGVVGNVAALLRGGDLLGDERRERLEGEMRELLARTAVIEEGLANWPAWEGRDLVADDGEIRVQWCAGAPGIVTSAASYLDEELLLAGTELAWRAGPSSPEKGAGICHGTAGNGYAFLKAFARTGDEVWLVRAQQFAVHALEQVDRLRQARGHGRYSLWTGDVGVALYAASCLDGSSGYPVVDWL